MRKVERCSVGYSGYKDPSNDLEIELEIAGLKTVIALAKQRVAVLEQSLVLQKLIDGATVDEKTVEEASENTENK